MEIKVADRKKTDKNVYTALSVTVKIGKKNHLLETGLIRKYTANSKHCICEVAEFDWITPEPEDSKRLKIEKAAKEHILSQFTKGKEDAD